MTSGLTNTGDLNGVSCVTASSCKAVGIEATSGVAHTLIDSWDGTTWSVDPSPNTGTGTNALTSSSCTSTSSCEAVGWYRTSTGNAQALIETYG